MSSTMSTVTPTGFLPGVTTTRWRLSLAGVLAVLVPLSLVAADVLASRVGPGLDILVGLCLIALLAAAVLGSSAVFGFWHIVPALATGPTNAAMADAVGEGFGGTALRLAGTVLITGLGGIVLCELRVRSGSLLAPILLHWAVNAGGVVFVLLA